MSTLLSVDVNTQVNDVGAGAPVLFLHGAPDSGEMWNAVIEPMCQAYRCVAPDLPGFGRSQAPADFDYSLENQARWVDGVVTGLDLPTPLNLVMHDFGGHFGLAWALRHPEKVRRLVISNTSFFSDYKWHSGAHMLRLPVIGELAMKMTNYKILSQNLRTGSPGLSEAHLRQTYDMFTPSVRRAMLRLYRASAPENFKGWEDDLLRLTERVPTMVLWGDLDPFAPPAYAGRYGAQRVRHFAQYGHWIPIEGAAEFAIELAAFL